MDYSELQKLQEELDQKEIARKPTNPQNHKPVSPQAGKTVNLLTDKPANPQAHIPAKPFAGKPVSPLDPSSENEIVEKYTTRLAPSMVRQIKIHAAQQDLKDYEVVEKALREYFERKK